MSVMRSPTAERLLGRREPVAVEKSDVEPAPGIRWQPMAPIERPTTARQCAGALIEGATQRWRHIEGAAAAAALAGGELALEDRELLASAAWLHDIGYASALVDTGFHPLDGARYLRSIGAPDRLCGLVANHTHAWIEAGARGLADQLAAEFPAEDSPVADALTYADMTTGPNGEPMTVEERIGEILQRYAPGHVVHESVRRAAPDLIATVRRVEARLAAL